MVQEQYGWGGSVTGGATSPNGKVLYDAIKAVTTLRCTCSGVNSIVYDSRYMDYADFHLYADGQPATYVDSFWTSNPTIKVIMGETGVNAGMDTTSRQARLNSALAILNHTGPSGQHMAGGLYWAGQDQSVALSNQWGLYDNFGTERTDATSIFQQWPIIWP